MAMSIAIFSSFLTRQSVTFSPPTLKLAPAKLRRVAVTAASNPDSAGSLSNDTNNFEPKPMSNSPGVSLEMQAFLGGRSDITGAEALKEVWAYIEEQNLQDPEDNLIIVCDEKLKTICGGQDRVNFLSIGGTFSNTTPDFLHRTIYKLITK